MATKIKRIILHHLVPLTLIWALAATGPALNSNSWPWTPTTSTLLLLPTLLAYYHRSLQSHPLDTGKTRVLVLISCIWIALALGHYVGYATAFQTPNDNDNGDLVNSLHPAVRLLLALLATFPYPLALAADSLILIRGHGHRGLAFAATLTAATFALTRLSPFGTWANFSDGIPTNDVSVAVLNLAGLHGLVFLCAFFASRLVMAPLPSPRVVTNHDDPSRSSQAASPYTLAQASSRDASLVSPPVSDLDLDSETCVPAPPPPPAPLLAHRVSSSMFAESGVPSFPTTPIRPAASSSSSRAGAPPTGQPLAASPNTHARATNAGMPALLFPTMRRLLLGPRSAARRSRALPATSLDPETPTSVAIPPAHTRARTSDTLLPPTRTVCPSVAASHVPRVLAHMLLTAMVLATYTSLVIRPATHASARSPLDPATDRVLHLGCVVHHQAPASDVWKATQVLANAAAAARNATWSAEAAQQPRLIVWSEEATRVASESERAALVLHAQEVTRTQGIWLALAYWEPAGLPPLTASAADPPPPPRAASKWVGNNKLTVVSPTGAIALDYAKVHPVFDVEADIRPGSARAPPVVDVDGVKVAGGICLDGDFDAWVQGVAREAEVLILPSWTWGSLGPTHRLHAQQRASATGLTVARCPSWGEVSVDLPSGDAVYTQRMGGQGTSPMVPVPVATVWTLQAWVPDWIAWASVAWSVLQVLARVVPAGPTAARARGDPGPWEGREERAPLLHQVRVDSSDHVGSGCLAAQRTPVTQQGLPLPYPSEFFASWGDDDSVSTAQPRDSPGQAHGVASVPRIP